MCWWWMMESDHVSFTDSQARFISWWQIWTRYLTCSWCPLGVSMVTFSLSAYTNESVQISDEMIWQRVLTSTLSVKSICVHVKALSMSKHHHLYDTTFFFPILSFIVRLLNLRGMNLLFIFKCLYTCIYRMKTYKAFFLNIAHMIPWKLLLLAL